MRGGGGEARGMGEGREGTYVLGRGWSPAGVGAAASRQRKTTAADGEGGARGRRRTVGVEWGIWRGREGEATHSARGTSGVG